MCECLGTLCYPPHIYQGPSIFPVAARDDNPLDADVLSKRVGLFGVDIDLCTTSGHRQEWEARTYRHHDEKTSSEVGRDGKISVLLVTVVDAVLAVLPSPQCPLARIDCALFSLKLEMHAVHRYCTKCTPISPCVCLLAHFPTRVGALEKAPMSSPGFPRSPSHGVCAVSRTCSASARHMPAPTRGIFLFPPPVSLSSVQR